VLKGKVLTWDRMQSRNKQGTRLCYLCRRCDESNTHVFLDCSFSRKVWIEIGRHLGINHLWDKETISNFFLEYYNRLALKDFQVLPILVAWGVWFARNASIF
jgi:hypothetical protein